MRLDLARPEHVSDAVARNSVAYVPIGAVEYHGPHLPLGVDLVTAQAVCARACADSGGVVLPPSYVALGTLDLPWTLCFSAELVERWATEVVDQLHYRGFELVVLLTGHGPLDLVHLLKRVARAATAAGKSTYAACYLEFNAALLSAPEPGEPTVIDHAATVESSWMLALQPENVDLLALPDDPEASVLGVYGRNPRFTASREAGSRQVEAAGEVLVQRVLQAQRGVLDDLEDLRAFVRFCWPEPLELRTEGATPGAAWLHNPGRASRYVTGIRSARLGDSALDLTGATVLNDAPGEVGTLVEVAGLGAESGLYLRRGQTATLWIPALGAGSAVGSGALTMDIELGGVTTLRVETAAGSPDEGPRTSSGNDRQ